MKFHENPYVGYRIVTSREREREREERPIESSRRCFHNISKQKMLFIENFREEF